jgi:conserved oligomeric Golgi complex subunit 6
MPPDRPLTPGSSLPSPLNINGDRKGVSQPRNPVSLRLYKVLSSNFDDEDTRQALGTLSDLYATPKSRDTLAVVEDVDDEVLYDSADGSYASTVLAESIPGESAAKARKCLRRDMENRLAEGSRKFLEALGEVDSVSRPSS